MHITYEPWFGRPRPGPRRAAVSMLTYCERDGPRAIRNHPLLKDVRLAERLGSEGTGGPVVTAGGLVFIGAGDGYLYAFDKATGKELWRGKLPYARTGTPMAYRARSGRQFVVIATGADADNALVAFALEGN
jgi:glucose dehydrogenase